MDLSGRKGLVLGLANERSIAYGCARAMRWAGADLAVTYRNERTRPHAQPLAERLGCVLVPPCDVQRPGELEAASDTIRDRWGRLDFAAHCIGAAAPADLRGRVADCSRDGFLRARDVSVHSFVRLARLAEPSWRARSVPGARVPPPPRGFDSCLRKSNARPRIAEENGGP